MKIHLRCFRSPTRRRRPGRAPAGTRVSQVRRIVYISSDPPAQAEDCSHFQWLGYETLTVQPFDAGPHSPAIVRARLGCTAQRKSSSGLFCSQT